MKFFTIIAILSAGFVTAAPHIVERAPNPASIMSHQRLDQGATGKGRDDSAGTRIASISSRQRLSQGSTGKGRDDSAGGQISS
ncbi:hypothetical protein J1614_002216 [Plenodomus biglobosus]|nr:hypothetical protein J1614_002216 [Plenodomus biglobosus]